MSEANTKQESRREAADRIADEYLEDDNATSASLSDAIEAALKEPDERAAKIAKNYKSLQVSARSALRELDFMLNAHPERRGGRYESAAEGLRAALNPTATRKHHA